MNSADFYTILFLLSTLVQGLPENDQKLNQSSNEASWHESHKNTDREKTISTAINIKTTTDTICNQILDLSNNQRGNGTLEFCNNSTSLTEKNKQITLNNVMKLLNRITEIICNEKTEQRNNVEATKNNAKNKNKNMNCRTIHLHYHEHYHYHQSNERDKRNDHEQYETENNHKYHINSQRGISHPYRMENYVNNRHKVKNNEWTFQYNRGNHAYLQHSNKGLNNNNKSEDYSQSEWTNPNNDRDYEDPDYEYGGWHHPRYGGYYGKRYYPQYRRQHPHKAGNDEREQYNYPGTPSSWRNPHKDDKNKDNNKNTDYDKAMKEPNTNDIKFVTESDKFSIQTEKDDSDRSIKMTQEQNTIKIDNYQDYKPSNSNHNKSDDNPKREWTNPNTDRHEDPGHEYGGRNHQRYGEYYGNQNNLKGGWQHPQKTGNGEQEQYPAMSNYQETKSTWYSLDTENNKKDDNQYSEIDETMKEPNLTIDINFVTEGGKLSIPSNKNDYDRASKIIPEHSTIQMETYQGYTPRGNKHKSDEYSQIEWKNPINGRDYEDRDYEHGGTHKPRYGAHYGNQYYPKGRWQHPHNTENDEKEQYNYPGAPSSWFHPHKDDKNKDGNKDSDFDEEIKELNTTIDIKFVTESDKFSIRTEKHDSDRSLKMTQVHSTIKMGNYHDYKPSYSNRNDSDDNPQRELINQNNNRENEEPDYEYRGWHHPQYGGYYGNQYYPKVTRQHPHKTGNDEKEQYIYPGTPSSWFHPHNEDKNKDDNQYSEFDKAMKASKMAKDKKFVSENDEFPILTEKHDSYRLPITMSSIQSSRQMETYQGYTKSDNKHRSDDNSQSEWTNQNNDRHYEDPDQGYGGWQNLQNGVHYGYQYYPKGGWQHPYKKQNDEKVQHSATSNYQGTQSNWYNPDTDDNNTDDNQYSVIDESMKEPNITIDINFETESGQLSIPTDKNHTDRSTKIIPVHSTIQMETDQGYTPSDNDHRSDDYSQSEWTHPNNDRDYEDPDYEYGGWHHPRYGGYYGNQYYPNGGWQHPHKTGNDKQEPHNYPGTPFSWYHPNKNNNNMDENKDSEFDEAMKEPNTIDINFETQSGKLSIPSDINDYDTSITTSPVGSTIQIVTYQDYTPSVNKDRSDDYSQSEWTHPNNDRDYEDPDYEYGGWHHPRYGGYYGNQYYLKGGWQHSHETGNDKQEPHNYPGTPLSWYRPNKDNNNKDGNQDSEFDDVMKEPNTIDIKFVMESDEFSIPTGKHDFDRPITISPVHSTMQMESYQGHTTSDNKHKSDYYTQSEWRNTNNDRDYEDPGHRYGGWHNPQYGGYYGYQYYPKGGWQHPHKTGNDEQEQYSPMSNYRRTQSSWYNPDIENNNRDEKPDSEFEEVTKEPNMTTDVKFVTESDTLSIPAEKHNSDRSIKMTPEDSTLQMKTYQGYTPSDNKHTKSDDYSQSVWTNPNNDRDYENPFYEYGGWHHPRYGGYYGKRYYPKGGLQHPYKTGNEELEQYSATFQNYQDTQSSWYYSDTDINKNDNHDSEFDTAMKKLYTTIDIKHVMESKKLSIPTQKDDIDTPVKISPLYSAINGGNYEEYRFSDSKNDNNEHDYSERTNLNNNRDYDYLGYEYEGWHHPPYGGSSIFHVSVVDMNNDSNKDLVTQSVISELQRASPYLTDSEIDGSSPEIHNTRTASNESVNTITTLNDGFEPDTRTWHVVNQNYKDDEMTDEPADTTINSTVVANDIKIATPKLHVDTQSNHIPDSNSSQKVTYTNATESYKNKGTETTATSKYGSTLFDGIIPITTIIYQMDYTQTAYYEMTDKPTDNDNYDTRTQTVVYETQNKYMYTNSIGTDSTTSPKSEQIESQNNKTENYNPESGDEILEIVTISNTMLGPIPSNTKIDNNRITMNKVTINLDNSPLESHYDGMTIYTKDNEAVHRTSTERYAEINLLTTALNDGNVAADNSTNVTVPFELQGDYMYPTVINSSNLHSSEIVYIRTESTNKDSMHPITIAVSKTTLQPKIRDKIISNFTEENDEKDEMTQKDGGTSTEDDYSESLLHRTIYVHIRDTSEDERTYHPATNSMAVTENYRGTGPHTIKGNKLNNVRTNTTKVKTYISDPNVRQEQSLTTQTHSIKLNSMATTFFDNTNSGQYEEQTTENEIHATNVDQLNLNTLPDVSGPVTVSYNSGNSSNTNVIRDILRPCSKDESNLTNMHENLKICPCNNKEVGNIQTKDKNEISKFETRKSDDKNCRCSQNNRTEIFNAREKATKILCQVNQKEIIPNDEFAILRNFSKETSLEDRILYFNYILGTIEYLQTLLKQVFPSNLLSKTL